MSYKPSDLFLGVIDFFAVILPGTLIAFLMLDFAKTNLFGLVLPAINSEIQGWSVFIFASYLLGHLVFLLGAFLDPVYDRVYVKRKRRNGDNLLDYATSVKNESLGKNRQITNTLQWASAIVRLESPNASIEIDRLDADSKFFRSITMVLFFIFIALSFRSVWYISLGCFGLMLLTFWRYAERRWKRTQLTYTYYVAIERASRKLTQKAGHEKTSASNDGE